jgi:hypothetical protein
MANRKSIESRWLRPLVRFTEKELKMFKHTKLTELFDYRAGA